MCAGVKSHCTVCQLHNSTTEGLLQMVGMTDKTSPAARETQHQVKQRG